MNRHLKSGYAALPGRAVLFASALMLAACARKCRELGVDVSLTRQFVQDLDLHRRYALAFIAAGSFGLLIDESDHRVGLRRVHDHLESGGEVILEAETPKLAPRRTEVWFGRWWDRPDGARIVLRTVSRYDPATHALVFVEDDWSTDARGAAAPRQSFREQLDTARVGRRSTKRRLTLVS